ncbi:MAG: cation:proton antiporter [Syntrophales bacterium]|jgi:Kef-type K+ transport system membrane component KefB/Trk K+ transport system NAD-binding subunit|nr:cation:proton antiporter [Syntrophales bacterium]MDY0045573.1 cation:proton antiporter [Syntrophales bacterium]
MHGNSFIEIASILGLSALLGLIGQKLRQPLLIMFLAAGVLAGPSFLGIIESYQQIELLASIGIALLLFIVGLRLDLDLIRMTGPVALATGLGQIVFTSTIGFGIAVLLGMSLVTAAYVSVALTFSSTIIIVKLLSDKKEIDSLHGQIAVGFLIVQDIAAILALVILTSFGAQVLEEGSVLLSSLIIVAKGVGLLLAVALLMKFVIPKVAARVARSQEMLLLFAIAWAVILGAASELIGFSKEVGAFLAGISLASTAYRETIGSRLASLRDFLLLFFFINLGARLDFATVGSQLGAAGIFSFFVLIGNPLIVLVIMGMMGFRRRTGFLAGLAVAQISEFSLIVAAMGLSIGHINEETMGLITLVGLITIFASTYLILYSGPLYQLLSVPLKIFEMRNPYRELAFDTLKMSPGADVILMGLGNYGSSLAEYLLQRNKTIIGVDFDPIALERWTLRGVSTIFGDIDDPDIHERLPLKSSHWVVSTVRSRNLNLALLHHLRDRRFAGRIALTAINEEEARMYETAGATVVFRPFIDAAEQAADELTYAMEFLPEDIDWPVSFREIRIRTDSSAAGKKIREIPLRSETGASILAVSRAGRIHYNPEPGFRIFPGDRVIIIGPIEALRLAESILSQLNKNEEDEVGSGRFDVTEVTITDNSQLSGITLARARFRQRYGVTVIGIKRGEEQIVAPSSTEILAAGDKLIIIGDAKKIESLEKKKFI